MSKLHLRKAWQILRTRSRHRRYRLALWCSTFNARQRLRKEGPLSVLVDNSILDHSRLSGSYWISTGTKSWGGHYVKTGHAASELRRSPEDKRLWRQLPYLPGIVYLAQLGHLKLFTSFELRNERLHQPAGRFTEMSYFDFNLFSGHQLPCIDCDDFESFDWRERPADRLRPRIDQPYRDIADLIAPKMNVDAWHLHTMEQYGLDYFLHIDHPLRQELKNHRKKSPIKELYSKVVFPENLGKQLQILPIDVGLII